MATIDSHNPIDAHGADVPNPNLPYHERYQAASHFLDREHEFDACKMGVWLFLSTEILLFSGMFCAYAIFRMLHPEAFIAGGHHLDIKWGLLNTIVLLFSSWTVASAVRNAQLGQNAALRRNLLITTACGVAFIVIKLYFEYRVKYQHGLLPGKFYSAPITDNPYEPLWWAVYWVSTGIHATHVLGGIGLMLWLWYRAGKHHFGPKHFTAVEGVGLYWHIVDIVWIFLFPMLYLIH
jgi:cytochrome c oxidase subunit 3